MPTLYRAGTALQRYIEQEQRALAAIGLANQSLTQQAAYLAGTAVQEGLPEGPFRSKTDALLFGILNGGTAMPATVGYQRIDLATDVVTALTPPAGAIAALVVVEVVSGTISDLTRVCRWLQTGDDPSASDGLPLGHLGQLVISQRTHLARARFRRIVAGTVRLHIEYRY